MQLRLDESWYWYDETREPIIKHVLLLHCGRLCLSPVTVTSGTDYITINPVLSAGAITPAAPTIDTGQSITLTSAASGGSGSLTIAWYSQAACGGSSVGSGTTYSPSPSSTTTYTYKVTDSATTPVSVCSTQRRGHGQHSCTVSRRDNPIGAYNRQWSVQ